MGKNHASQYANFGSLQFNSLKIASLSNYFKKLVIYDVVILLD